jgi:hypothetical protein
MGIRSRVVRSTLYRCDTGLSENHAQACRISDTPQILMHVMVFECAMIAANNNLTKPFSYYFFEISQCSSVSGYNDSQTDNKLFLGKTGG